MSIVNNVEIMGLESSITASGYSMKADLREVQYNEKRALNLARAGGGEEQFLTGIIVNFDLTFTIKAWVEAERYRFLNFVSSQSTMHCITRFNLSKQCNDYVTTNTMKEIDRLIEQYKKDSCLVNRLKLLYNIPTGFKLTARMTTNYRCLQNIYKQRRKHTLPEWREFCEWIETLPMSELITGGVNDERMDSKTRD